MASPISNLQPHPQSHLSHPPTAAYFNKRISQLFQEVNRLKILAEFAELASEERENQIRTQLQHITTGIDNLIDERLTQRQMEQATAVQPLLEPIREKFTKQQQGHEGEQEEKSRKWCLIL